MLAWEVASSHSHVYFDDIFPTDESILEVMSGVEKPWGELHNRYYFLPELEHIECDDYRDILSEKFGMPVIPLGTPSNFVEGNMANLSPTIPINISHALGKIENVYIGVDCSPNQIEAYTNLFK